MEFDDCVAYVSVVRYIKFSLIANDAICQIPIVNLDLIGVVPEFKLSDIVLAN